MAAYMKHQFAFFGVTAPQRRRLERAALRAAGRPTEDEVVAFVRAAWGDPERELQYAAAGRLGAIAPVSSAGLLEEVELLIRSKSWWDTVDDLASHTVGPLVRAHPDLVSAMDAWIADDDIWIARAALLHQLGAKEATDTDRLFGYCLARADDREFFIRKAIGWALRQYSWTDPDAVETFVVAHGDRLSPLSRREATKRLPARRGEQR